MSTDRRSTSAAACAIVAALFASACQAAGEAPSNAAVEQVFKQTVQRSASVAMAPGQTCARPAVRRFAITGRKAPRVTAETPQGFYPMTAEVELQCGTGPDVSVWKGEIELHVYQNAQQLWETRW